MTGGDGQYMGDLSDMFYNPEGYNVLPYRHNYTKTGEYVLTGFFVPAYTFVTAQGMIDSRGVTNTKKAREYHERERNNLLRDPKAYLIQCAEFCFTPDEAFSLEGDNIFNKVLLADQLTSIRLGNCPTIEHGTLEYQFKGGIVQENMIQGVIFKSKLGGHVHILEHPKRTEDNNVPKNLYVAGIDGIDMGQEDTSDYTKDPSSFCVVVFRRAYGTHPPQIVAYYKDRPERIKEAHITCLKLLQYYDAMACLESTRISLLQFFKEKKCADKYLMRRPRACQSDIQNGRSRQFGAQANENIIRHQLELIADYIEEYCGEIWFQEILEELNSYSYENKRKFDTVAALGMVMLANEELMFVVPKLDDKSNKFKDFGFYIDEYGIKRKGIIPDKYKFQDKVKITMTTKIYESDSYGYERLRDSYK